MTTPDKTDTAPSMNHVFVDFENVQEIDASAFGSRPVSFT